MTRLLHEKTRKMLLAAFCLTAGVSWGQAIFSNEITGTNPNADNPYTTGQVVDPNITAGGIGRGEGVTGANANNRYNANSWNTDALDATAYYEFTLTPDSGYEIDFESFVYNAQKSNTGPVEYVLRSSADGYTANIYTLSSPASNNFGATVDLSGAAFQNVDEAITFRFYAWGTTNAGGTFSINDFIFNGVVDEACDVVPVPVVDDQEFCVAGTVGELEAEGTGTIQWYDEEEGGAALGNDTTLASGTYYVTQTINGCESEREEVEVTINVTPVPDPAEGQVFCGTTTVADIEVEGTGIIRWYAAATGGEQMSDAAEIETGTYYVAQSLNSCESERVAVSVTVNNTDEPEAEDQDFCGPATVADLEATGMGTMQWYVNSTDTVVLPDDTELVTGTYYVSQTMNDCESERVEVMVSVNIVDDPNDISQAVCDETTFGEIEGGGTGLIQWYVSEDSTEALENDEEVVAGTYYISQTVNGCESERIAVEITVTEVEDPDGEEMQAFHAGETLADLIVEGDNIVWFADEALTMELPETTVLVDGAIYFAVSMMGDCMSEPLEILVDEILGTSSFNMSGLKYYPNPVKDILTITNPEAISSVVVYNLLGQLVLAKEYNAVEAPVDMTALSAGSYLVKVTSGSQSETVKIVRN